jgi:hypothetical protein
MRSLRTINIGVDIDVDDILDELKIDDIIKWITDRASLDNKRILAKMLVSEMYLETPVKLKTLNDVQKYEALEKIWDELAIEDIENFKK